jgi:class 3 adenylate cyclase/pimeloyl-ACP methyl ester carboxylesterase
VAVTVEVSEPRYVTSDAGIELAYAVAGSGERTIVKVTAFGSSLDETLEGGSTTGRWVFERVPRFARLVLFDRRGQGLSSRSFGFGTLEDRMDDIRLVMDATATDQAVLIADHDSVCHALLFAATYPERVSALVLTSVSGPRVRWAPDYLIGHHDEFLDAFSQHVLETWGTGRVFASFAGARVPTRELARAERAICTPLMAREHFTRAFDMDVREALPAVRAPALVIHGVDELMRIEWARYLVDHLPDATLIEAPGRGFMDDLDASPHHLSNPIAPLVDAVEEFVTGERPRRVVDVDRVLATVLFVDIATSTEHLVTMGDRQWSELITAFRSGVRNELARYRGREVNYRGDDVLAVFDGSTRAIRCAQAIAARASDLGVEVRAGAHTGEVEIQGDDIAGIAVNVGARVCAEAAPREILVTRTLRDLVAGSGLAFDPRGSHELKGIPERFDLYAVIP